MKSIAAGPLSTDLQNPTEFSPRGKPIRNLSIDPTSSIRTRLRTPFLRTPFPRLLFKILELIRQQLHLHLHFSFELDFLVGCGNRHPKMTLTLRSCGSGRGVKTDPVPKSHKGVCGGVLQGSLRGSRRTPKKESKTSLRSQNQERPKHNHNHNYPKTFCIGCHTKTAFDDTSDEKSLPLLCVPLCRRAFGASSGGTPKMKNGAPRDELKNGRGRGWAGPYKKRVNIDPQSLLETRF